MVPRFFTNLPGHSYTRSAVTWSRSFFLITLNQEQDNYTCLILTIWKGNTQLYAEKLSALKHINLNTEKTWSLPLLQKCFMVFSKSIHLKYKHLYLQRRICLVYLIKHRSIYVSKDQSKCQWAEIDLNRTTYCKGKKSRKIKFLCFLFH